MTWVLITPHQGLGDHLLCNGLYRQYARKNGRVFISVKRNYYSEVSNMLRDLSNVTLIMMPNNKSWRTTRFIQFLAKLLRIRTVGLGSYGDDFFPQGIRFDNNFYNQAGIEFSHRWESFYSPRNYERELELFRTLDCQSGNYIFMHEDVSRNFTINQKLLPEGLRVITPLDTSSGFYLVDYRQVIENACQIHVIESSFAAFVESIPVKGTLFAHRYARHHALNDFRHEFSYRKPWTIIIEQTV